MQVEENSEKENNECKASIVDLNSRRSSIASSRSNFDEKSSK